MSNLKNALQKLREEHREAHQQVEKLQTAEIKEKYFRTAVDLVNDSCSRLVKEYGRAVRKKPAKREVSAMPETPNSNRWSSATLRIFSANMLPDEIETALGLKATRTHRKGERHSPRHDLVWRESAWLLSSPI